MGRDALALIEIITDPKNTKSVKAAALAKLRQIERETGTNLFGSYNHEDTSSV